MLRFNWRKKFIILSTGELEFAILCKLSGVKLTIFDFSPNSCEERNRNLIKSFGMVNHYHRPSKKSLILHKVLGLLTFNLAVSANSFADAGMKRYVQAFFRVSFFRDALIARPKVNYTDFFNFYCEPECKQFFPNAKIISLRSGTLENFISIAIQKRSLFEKGMNDFDCIIIGKQMNRTSLGSKLKNDFYNVVKKKFQRVALIPHPRETIQELELAERFGFEIIDMLPYLIAANEKTIFVVGGSSGTLLRKFDIPFFWVFFPDEFIYHGGITGLHGEHAVEKFYTIESILSYSF